MTKMISIIVVLLLFALGCEGGKTKPQERKIRTAKVTKGDIQIVLNEVGTIEPLNKVEVKSKIGGKVTEILVREGQEVRNGQILACIQPDVNQAQILSQITSSLKKADIELKQAEKDLRRNEGLFQKGYISREELDQALNRYHIAQIEYNTLQHQLELLGGKGTSIGSFEVLAPCSGVVISKDIEVGEIAVSPMMSYTGGTVLFVIGDLSKMVIESTVNEVDIGKVKLGQPVRITVDAFPGEEFSGEVLHIAPSAKDVEGIKVFDVKVELISADPRLRPGMTANVDVFGEARKGVLTVPIEAVFREDNKDIVYVKKDSDYEKREIATGINDIEKVEVVKGLEEGEIVALEIPTPQEVE